MLLLRLKLLAALNETLGLLELLLLQLASLFLVAPVQEEPAEVKKEILQEVMQDEAVAEEETEEVIEAKKEEQKEEINDKLSNLL